MESNPQIQWSKPAAWRGARAALANHWPEYFAEAANLGLFMISACVFTTLLGHPASALHQAIDSPFLRLAIAGLAMGLTAIGIVYSPLGQRSGAHMNPSVTLTYLSLGKLRAWDAAFYVLFQFFGGAAGVALMALVIGPPLGHMSVNYAVTEPGPAGWLAALAAEFAISLFLMLILLAVTNRKEWAPWTPLIAGLLVAAYIAFEAPVSGMSMNPARSLGSALVAGEWKALWIYFVGPPLGMLLAGQLFRMRRGLQNVFCAKLHHHNSQRCIFNCNYGAIHERG